ncbi:hypothetical protein CDD83_11118 [Cordyceps sp. RAO-2017]|nr:hypothetical protein CDD83_11118 [Cordyceps sp. RAO-2017]
MGRKHWSFATLLGSTVLPGSSLARSVPYSPFMTLGQGFNTFEGKGALHGVVKFVGNRKREQLSAFDPGLTFPPHGQDFLFNFTGPSGDLTGVDLNVYLKPVDPRIIDDAIDEMNQDARNDSDLKALPYVRRSYIPVAPCNAQVFKSAGFVFDYEAYLRSLDISASSVIQGWGQGASISGNYLDESQFSADTLTYVAKLELHKQPDPHDSFEFDLESYEENKDRFAQVYGNRWIRGFERGGKLIIRVSIKSKKDSRREEIMAGVEASFSGFGMSATLGTSAKKSVEKLSAQANMKMKFEHIL